MAERKIIEFKVVEADAIEDRDVCTNSDYRIGLMRIGEREIPEPTYATVYGLNTKMNELIKQGFVPYGEIKKIDTVNRHKSWSMLEEFRQETVSTTTTWVREFVKYEE